MIKLLDGILTEQHREEGFYLKEVDDHFVYLMWNGKEAGVFTQATTAKQLNDAADELMAEMKRGRQG